MSGKSSLADILLVFFKNADNIPTNKLNDVLEKIDINAADAFKNIDADGLTNLIKNIDSNKFNVEPLITAIKNSDNGNDILKTVLDNVGDNTALGQKIKSAMGDVDVNKVETPTATTNKNKLADLKEKPEVKAGETQAGIQVGEQIEEANNVLKKSGVSDDAANRVEGAIIENMAKAESPNDVAKQLQDNRSFWQKAAAGDVKSVNAFASIIGKLAVMGIPLGVGYAIAKHWYDKLNEGKENEILCYATCLPESWDSADVAGFGGTVELGDSSLGYKYLDNRKQSPHEPGKDVLIDENTNKDWDWNTQPLCKKAGKPNCDTFCRTKCGEVHNVELPFEMFSRELGETLGAGVNGLFDGIGLGGLSATVKTLITSIFSIIVIGLIFYMIFVMISKKNNK